MTVSNLDLKARLQTIRRTPKRLAVGTSIMAISGLIGAALFATEQAMVSALQLTSTIAAGQSFSTADWQVVEVPISLAEGLLDPAAVSSELIASHQLSRGVLLDDSDVTQAQDFDPLVSLSLARSLLPAGLEVGRSVELWRVDPDSAELLVSDIEVVNLADDEVAGSAQVTLSVPSGAVPQVLSAAAAGAVAVVAIF